MQIERLWPLLLSVIWASVSQSVQNSVISGEVMAFVDFNYDRLTDLVVLTGESELTLFAAVVDSDNFQNFTRLPLKLTSSGSAVIVNVVGNDFDGDSNLDLAITWRRKDLKGDGVNVTFYWGTPHSGEFVLSNNSSPLAFSAQPGLVDCNLDGLSDLLGEVQLGSDDTHLRCIGVVDRHTRQLGNLTFPSPKYRLWRGQAAAFVDLTGNSIPDVVLMVNSSTDGLTPSFNVYSWDEDKGEWVLDSNLMSNPFTQDADRRLMSFHVSNNFKDLQVAQPVFADFDGNGQIDLLLPVCYQLPCSKPSLYVWSNGTWHIVKVDLTNPSGTVWSFSAYSENHSWKTIEGMTLKMGDIDQNGFPDLTVPMRDLNFTGSPITNAFILENSPCGGAECDGWSRTFRVKWTPHLFVTNVTTVAFMDLKEDGLLDQMVEVVTAAGTKETNFFLTEDTSDTCFLKVEVYTATCLSNCTAASKRDNIGYVAEGSIIPLPGSTLWIQRTSPDGDTLYSAAGQLPQSAFRPLSLPFITFGLDRTTNFVERLRVSIPYFTAKSHSWTQIIPNSRLYIVPYPPDKPDSWVSRLYVTPSRLILLSFAALASVCAVIVVVIAVLHCVEKRADKKEKLQDAHKFHFDAM